MNRTGLFIALALAAVVGAVFGVAPQFDLQISAPFHAIVRGGNNYFGLRIDPTLMLLRDAMLWLVTVFAVAPGIALLIKLLVPTRRLVIPARAILFLGVVMALGPGLLTNVILKEHWSRPRPIDVQQFGGQEHFVAWWDPRGDCPNNCSFVSGDVSGAAWMFAPAALAPPAWRPLAYATAAMAALRIAFGGHFLTDTVFAGVFTFLIVWVVYAAIYRWSRPRLSEAALEALITRLAMPGYRLLMRLFHRRV